MSIRSADDYYPWFDWLRLVAATVVVLSHLGDFARWPRAGEFAVRVFFALSGWLIGGILIKLPRHELPRFYFNRALRIWCPYLLALFLLVSVSLSRDHITSKWTETVFYMGTFVFNIFGLRQIALYRFQMPLEGTGSHFWSVNAEEQFYLLAPLVLVLMPRRISRSLVVWVGVAFLALWGQIYASIVLGVLAAVIAHKFPALFRDWRYRGVAVLLVLASAIGLFAGADYELASPFCALGIVLLLSAKGARHRWGEIAGGMSYPLYLNAWIAMFFVNFVAKRSRLVPPITHDALAVAMSFALAVTMYWFIDRQILAQRSKLFSVPRARMVMIAAYSSVALGICIGILLYHRGGL